MFPKSAITLTYNNNNNIIFISSKNHIISKQPTGLQTAKMK